MKQIRTKTALITFATMEDQTNNEVIEAVEKGLKKMENEGVLNGSDFTKPWRSSDVIFLVDEQRFYVHRPGGVLPRILDRGVPRRFVNPNPI